MELSNVEKIRRVAWSRVSSDKCPEINDPRGWFLCRADKVRDGSQPYRRTKHNRLVIVVYFVGHWSTLDPEEPVYLCTGTHTNAFAALGEFGAKSAATHFNSQQGDFPVIDETVEAARQKHWAREAAKKDQEDYKALLDREASDRICERRAKLRTNLAEEYAANRPKFKKAKAPAAVKEKPFDLEGFAACGLIAHKRVGKVLDNGLVCHVPGVYDVSHIGSGLCVLRDFGSINQAKAAIYFLSKIAIDWTDLPDAITERAKQIGVRPVMWAAANARRAIR